jgi:prophage DNA circulation protein
VQATIGFASDQSVIVQERVGPAAGLAHQHDPGQRAAMMLDLLIRGSLLPRLITVTRAIALPSLALAFELYGDASRSDDLIARVDPPHPGFFPLEFEALSY